MLKEPANCQDNFREEKEVLFAGPRWRTDTGTD
jgi:hypothetical protein